MTTKQEFVDEVRTWIDTPFHHEARVKGAGVDCVGLAIGACVNLGIEVKDPVTYPKVPTNGMLEAAVRGQTIPVEKNDLQIGDVMLFRFKEEPQHLAIVSQVEGQVLIVHSFLQAGKCVEVNYDEFWQERLVDVRRIPELT